MTTPSNQALKDVLAKSATDASFREQLLANPDAAGISLPAGTTFCEAPNSADANAILLPPFGGDADEISDKELQDVAGGVLDPMDPGKTNINYGGCVTGPNGNYQP